MRPPARAISSKCRRLSNDVARLMQGRTAAGCSARCVSCGPRSANVLLDPFGAPISTIAWCLSSGPPEIFRTGRNLTTMSSFIMINDDGIVDGAGDRTHDRFTKTIGQEVLFPARSAPDRQVVS